MHALEKILARAAGKESVKPGEIVNCTVDLAGINDLYLQTLRSFFEMGGSKVLDPNRIVMFLDHYAPASTIAQADNQNIKQLMDVDQGVCHQVLADQGLVWPGQLLVVTDSHTTTHGAFGAFGTGVGATDLAIIMITGKLWFRVPEVICIQLDGKLSTGVYAKDVILKIIGELKADYAAYKAVEFTGPALAGFSVSERMTLCNMTTEMGAKTSYIQPDEITEAFLSEKVNHPYETVFTDSGYVYAAEHAYDISAIKPQVAAPSSVDNVSDAAVYAGRAIDQAFIGTCTGGRLADLASLHASWQAGKCTLAPVCSWFLLPRASFWRP
jgi:homoaconitase/3-isopropylmalate dehydratase large subunit